MVRFGQVGTALPAGELNPVASFTSYPNHVPKSGKVRRSSILGKGRMDNIGNAARPILLAAVHGLPQLSEALRVITTGTPLSPDDGADFDASVASGGGKGKGGGQLPARDEPLINCHTKGRRHTRGSRFQVKVHGGGDFGHLLHVGFRSETSVTSSCPAQVVEGG